MLKLQGKVALVSGSGRGIGRAVAQKLASEGARLVINDLDAEPAHEAAAAIRSMGTDVAVCVGDVTATDFGNRFVQTALDAFGGLDIIVNNAGYTWDSVIQKMSDEQFDAMLDVHLKAPFRILRAAADPLREAAKREAAEGRAVHRKVVNVSSVSGVWGNAGQVNYAAGKAGITGVTRALAREWGRYKVNVNAVAFGLISTRMTQAVSAQGARIDVAGRALPVGIPESAVRAIEAQIPLGRGGTPEEAAGAVYLFCIPESDYVSGQVLLVTGGQ